MPAWAYLLGGIAAFITAVVGSVAALRKLPAEAQRINVDTVDVNVKIAGELRDDAVDEWRRIKLEAVTLRREFEQYREDCNARISELSTQLRAEKADRKRFEMEAGRLELENGLLRARVDELEAEVARLKADR